MSNDYPTDGHSTMGDNLGNPFLADFQLQNCWGCFYADETHPGIVGSGFPCCTKPSQIETKKEMTDGKTKIVCLSRKEKNG